MIKKLLFYLILRFVLLFDYYIFIYNRGMYTSVKGNI